MYKKLEKVLDADRPNMINMCNIADRVLNWFKNYSQDKISVNFSLAKVWHCFVLFIEVSDGF